MGCHMWLSIIIISVLATKFSVNFKVTLKFWKPQKKLSQKLPHLWHVITSSRNHVCPPLQSWKNYFIKVIYYILLFTFANSNALQLHIT